MLERFERELRRTTGGECTSVLAALSGGADSTALLLLFDALRSKAPEGEVRVEAFHLHHGIRGEEADRDLAFCRDLCARRGVPLHEERADVPAEAKKRRIGLEECGRILRYEALERIADERGLRWIATAHNTGDQAETVLFRAARGSGLRGLGGIPERRGRIIRPLLCFTKKELEEFCRQNGESFVVDSTNGEDLYTRNALRHKVMPELEKLCPGAEKNISRMAESLREDEEFLCSLVPQGNISAKELQALPPPLKKRWLAENYRAFCAKTGDAGELERTHVEALCAMVDAGQTGAEISLPGCVKAVLGRDRLRFMKDRRGGAEQNAYAVVPTSEKTDFYGGIWAVYLTDGETYRKIPQKNEKGHISFRKISLDSAIIEGGLLMRPRQRGDRIAFGGMTREVSKLAAAATGDPRKRRNYPVLCDDQGVLWVPGYPPRGTGKEKNAEAQASEKIYIVLEERTDELP